MLRPALAETDKALFFPPFYLFAWNANHFVYSPIWDERIANSISSQQEEFHRFAGERQRFSIRIWNSVMISDDKHSSSLYLDGALMCHLINFWSFAIRQNNFHFRVESAGADDNDSDVTTRLQFRFYAASRTSHDNSLSNIFASIMIVAQKKGRNWT